MGAIWVIFVWLYFADHLGMANLLFLVGRDVIVVDNEKRIGTRHSFGAWLGALPNALTQFS